MDNFIQITVRVREGHRFFFGVPSFNDPNMTQKMLLEQQYKYLIGLYDPYGKAAAYGAFCTEYLGGDLA